jgi:hypothetical protein
VRKVWFLFVVLVMIGAVVASAGPAVADASDGRGAAKATGDDLVAQLMKQRKGGACTTASKRGFFDRGSGYLASCTGQDGDFRFLVIVQAKPGGLNVNSPYVQQRIDDICAGSGGAVYSVGVKDRFVAMYLGRGADRDATSGAAKAYGLWSSLAEQLQSTGGRFVAANSCADGKVLKKLI